MIKLNKISIPFAGFSIKGNNFEKLLTPHSMFPHTLRYVEGIAYI